MIRQVLKSLLVMVISAAVLLASIYGLLTFSDRWNQINDWDLNTQKCSQICYDQWTYDQTNVDNCCLNDHCSSKKQCQNEKLELYSTLLKGLLLATIISGGFTLAGLIKSVVACFGGLEEQNKQKQTKNKKLKQNRQRNNFQQERQRHLLNESMQESQRKIKDPHFYYDVISRKRIQCLGMCPQCS